MNLRCVQVALLAGVLLPGAVPPVRAEQPAVTNARKTRVTGVVRDETNGISLPGIPIEVVGGETVYSDVDGRYVVDLVPGSYELEVAMEGYQEMTAKVVVAAGVRTVDVNIGITMARFAETVVVRGDAPIDAVTSSQEVQLIERKNAPMISDNLGASEMRSNNDGDAAAAMQRVTGISVVDNQYVFVRGLGERYSNTQLSGATLPTTEPDKKVVPLDMFPSGLLDSVQVAKSYSPDKSAEFAGGLVQVNPITLPSRPVLDFSYGLSGNSISTGKSIPLSSLGSRDWLGFDNGIRALPGSFPDSKIVRRGIFTPTVGFTPAEISAFGRALDNTWRPQNADGAPGQNWGLVAGNRFGSLGVVASLSQSYRETFQREGRAFYRLGEGDELEAVSDYEIEAGTQRAQIGGVANLSYQATTNHRLSFENFYTHSGRDEGRRFEGPNTENNFYYFNNRVQFIEEGLVSNGLSGEHFFRGLSNSRLDWRATYSRASRDEPDLRETLYQANLVPIAGGGFTYSGTPVLADESQSGFRMFNDLEDNTLDVAANWSIFSTAGDRPTQYKFGLNVVDRDRAFQSRRFRFIPITTGSGSSVQANLTLTPEEIFTSNNIGTAFRFNEETRPVDAYDGAQTTYAGYGMVDIALRARTRLVAGARVERFEQHGRLVRPVRAVRRHHHLGEQEHRRLPVGQPGAGHHRQLEPPPGLQLHRQPPRVPRGGHLRVHRRGRRPCGARQPRPAPRHHPERGRPLGTVPRGPQRGRGERVLQVLQRAHRAHRDCRRAADRHLPERRERAQLRARARSGPAGVPPPLRRRQLHLSSTRRSHSARASGRCRPRSRARWPVSRRTSSTSPPSSPPAASTCACW